MEDFTTFVCYALKSTMKKVERHIIKGLDEFGVNMAQSFILFCLLEKDGSTLSEIGNRAQIENSSLTTMVDKLERDGLVERRLCSQDRRVIRLHLTDKGRAMGQEILSIGTQLNNRFRNELGDISEDFMKGLHIISNTLDNLDHQQH
ncbi:MAG TPA: MarR family transcriptional regulator [Syntrophomonadaceae bacterium]|nr:MarR family transcriptional regulator [Syntrophomonadaceae bacterium]HQA06522.1 MarR family transcriptional regulator [Syntrophomonadaceae bacterium]